jgi:hydroxymethylglutaryl-CoA lyase
MTRRVELVDVAPRDGLQGEAVVATAVKAELVERLLDAGLRRVEAVSFAHPGRVPQMADAESLMELLPRRDGVRYSGLVLNERGVERAVQAGVDEINVVVVVSDTFSERNQSTSTAQALDAWVAIARRAAAVDLPASVTLAAAFGCPYEGEVAIERLVDVAAQAVEAGPAELVLADTIGAAVPADVAARLAAVRDAVGDVRLRCHFHNTRNTGIANAHAAVEAGVGVLDASLGGIGGCPFAPRAVGNIPTEDLVYLLHRQGIETGVSLERLIAHARWLGEQLGHQVPGLLSRAGPFPPAGASTRMEEAE